MKEDDKKKQKLFFAEDFYFDFLRLVLVITNFVRIQRTEQNENEKKK